MKTKFLFILILNLILLNSQSYAQKKGKVEGIVKDAVSGEVLSYATVTLQGTSIGCVTDEKGFYSIQSIVAGKYILKASYIGYADTIVPIVISPDKVFTQNMALTIYSIMGEEVVVTAQAQGQMKAMNNQINATTIKNIVSDVKIRELPDANAAEALSRLPGVAISREGGEATKITIRGVEQNTIYVNGMPLLGGLANISSSMIGSIELSKAFLPSQDAGVLGGSVEMKMREAESGFKSDVWLRTGYNGFTKSFKMHDVSVALSNRFFKDKLGVMAVFTYDKKDRGRDVLSAGYNTQGSSVFGARDIKPVRISNVSLTHSQNLNNRYGVTLFTDYKLKNGKLYYQGFFSDKEAKDRSSNNAYDYGQIGYNSNITDGRSRNIMNGIGGDHKLLGAKIDWGLSLSQQRDKTLKNLSYNSIQGADVPLPNSVNDSTTITEFLALGTPSLNSTYGYNLAKYDSDDSGDEYNLKLNVEVPVKFGNFFDGFLKFGGKIRDISQASERDQHSGVITTEGYEKLSLYIPTSIPEYNWTYLANGKLGHEGFTSGGNSSEDFSMLGAKTYFFPDFDKVEHVIDVMSDKFSRNMSSKTDEYELNEKYYAAYIMASLNITKYVTFLPGVRYEDNRQTTTARKLLQVQNFGPETSQGVFEDTTATSSSADWFPMIHLKINPTKWFDIRLSYTQTLSRPGYHQLSPRYHTDISKNLTTGNIFLTPQYNTNYDIYFSFYKGKFGLFTAGAFYKEVTNQILDYSVTVLNPADYGLAPSFKGKRYNRPVNNKEPGYIKGIEFDWQTQFSFLPKPFNGIIFNSNLTYMQSETKYPFFNYTTIIIKEPPYKQVVVLPDNFIAQKISGMPDAVSSTSLGYELGGFSGRVSFYYQSFTLYTGNPLNYTLDESKDHLQRWDLQLSQKVNKYLTCYLNVNNLTNNPDRVVLTHIPDRLISEERYGASGDIGIRFKF